MDCSGAEYQAIISSEVYTLNVEDQKSSLTLGTHRVIIPECITLEYKLCGQGLRAIWGYLGLGYFFWVVYQ